MIGQLLTVNIRHRHTNFRGTPPAQGGVLRNAEKHKTYGKENRSFVSGWWRSA